MAFVMQNTEMKRTVTPSFLEQAKECEPKLYESMVKPVSIVDIQKNGKEYPDVSVIDTAENISSYPLGKKDSVCLDFGDHQVGYVTLRFSSVGSPQDAPAFIRLKFGEIVKGDDREFGRL